MNPLDAIRPYAPVTFGSASFMSRLEAVQVGLHERGEGKALCPYVGGLADSDEPGNRFTMIYARSASMAPSAAATEMRDGSGHLLTVAPTRAGKGTGQIVPNLLRWSGSALVLDVKGENYLRSAGFRKGKLGQRVVRFAPFEETSSRWNPVMSIRADLTSTGGGAEEEEDARYLVNLIVAPSGSANDTFWENSAKTFLEGLLLYVRTSPLFRERVSETDGVKPAYAAQVRERSMGEVRRLLTLDEEQFSKGLLLAMARSGRALVRQAATTMQRLTKGEGKTGNSILAVALEQTAVWAYQRVQRVSYVPAAEGEPGRNDFEFHDLRNGATTLYIIIPPEQLTEYRSVLRVMIGMAMRQLRYSWREKDSDKPPVMFFLDEFPQLAYMRPIEEALLYLAGYGVRFWFFIQDLSQLQVHYPKSWQTFFANTGTQSFFGVSDIATANLVSETAGSATVINRSFGANYGEGRNSGGSYSHGTQEGSNSNSGHGPGGATSGSGTSRGSSETYSVSWGSSISEGRSANVAFVGRRLIMPDEVLRMHDQEQIIFMKGLKPIRATRMPWYENEELRALGNLPPPEPVNFG